METTKTTIASISSFAKYRDLNDLEQVAKVADNIGALSREEYLELVSEWKTLYKCASERQRSLKPLRKGGTPEAADAIYEHRVGRDQARALMLVRTALKEVARRHHASRKAAA
jgi:hypothetical protein